MNSKHAMVIIVILNILLGYSEAKTVRIAAIQMNCKVGELETNLKTAEKFVRKAFDEKAEMVILPEFFTTPAFCFAYNDKIVEAVCPLNGKPTQLMKQLSQEYGGIVGGSFLAFHGEDTYNSFVLVFPDGKMFVHNKDYPTMHENCYYTGGDDDGIFKTPIGNIGVALCWEFVRTDTAKRLFGKVDIVIGGSCWSAGNSETDPNNYSLKLLKTVPNQFSRILGVPIIHSNHVGIVRYVSSKDKTNIQTEKFLGEAQIVDGYGKTLKKLSFSDGEGIIIEDVVLGKVDAPTNPIPDGFWIPELPKPWTDFWKDSLTGDFRKYYEQTALPAYLERWSKD